MNCVSCDSPEIATLESRKVDYCNSVRRRKVCQSCGHRFTTYELYLFEDKVVKNSVVHQFLSTYKDFESFVKNTNRTINNTLDQVIKDLTRLKK